MRKKTDKEIMDWFFKPNRKILALCPNCNKCYDINNGTKCPSCYKE